VEDVEDGDSSSAPNAAVGLGIGGLRGVS
jgi:hypothetical protein